MDREKYLLAPFAANEGYIRERSAQGIEANRKGGGCIKICDSKGVPVKGAHIRLVQKNHDFKYGANIFMLDEFESEEKNRIYREVFPQYFNLATVPFYWDDLEPEEGKPRFAKDSPRIYRRPAPDLCVEYCREKGITPKAHCLNYDRDTPPWMAKYDRPTQWQILERRIRQCAERYAGCIPGWEVTNETFWPNAKSVKYYDREYVERSFRLARQYLTENELIINEDQAVFRNDFLGERNFYFMQVERALLKGAPIDTVGFQYHQLMDAAHEREWIGKMFDPQQIYAIFDTFDALGLRYQMTEITIPCLDPQSRAAEELQAELIRQLYTIWFGISNMEAIIYWNLVDGYAYNAQPGDFTAGQNLLAGGLMHFDLTPKPALNVIRRLFEEEWRTREELVADDFGRAPFRGFYGSYEAEITVQGKTVKKTLHLQKGGKTEFCFTV